MIMLLLKLFVVTSIQHVLKIDKKLFVCFLLLAVPALPSRLHHHLTIYNPQRHRPLKENWSVGLTQAAVPSRSQHGLE